MVTSPARARTSRSAMMASLMVDAVQIGRSAAPARHSWPVARSRTTMPR